jgi:hypothetical protein
MTKTGAELLKARAAGSDAAIQTFVPMKTTGAAESLSRLIGLNRTRAETEGLGPRLSLVRFQGSAAPPHR